MGEIILFLCLALVAEILGTVGGFGSSLFFVPMASFFFDFQSVLGITAALHIMSNVAKLALFRKGIDKKLIIRIGIPSVVAVLVGSLLTAYVQTKYLEILLSVFLIGLSTLLLLLPHFSLKPNWPNAVLGGGLSGFLAGLVGTGGAIRGLLLTAFGLEKDVFVASSALIDLGVDVTRGIIYFSDGYLKKEHLYLVPILLSISFAGTFLGKKILGRISGQVFKKIVLFMVLATGILSTLNAFHIFSMKI